MPSNHAANMFTFATILSFFLTSSPPDESLKKAVAKGKLSDPIEIEAQVRRLFKHYRVKNFLSSFTGQWLDLNLLPDIMPDNRLLNWNENDLAAIVAETELFVAEILRDNLRELAHSHSWTLRGIDVELNAAMGQRFILVIKLKMIF